MEEVEGVEATPVPLAAVGASADPDEEAVPPEEEEEDEDELDDVLLEVDDELVDEDPEEEEEEEEGVDSVNVVSPPPGNSVTNLGLPKQAPKVSNPIKTEM